MPDISINIPMGDAEQTIEIEVKVNGAKQRFHYRVEIISWEDDCQPAEMKVECLKRKISEFEHDYQLVHIGSPAQRNIPVMFKRRN